GVPGLSAKASASGPTMNSCSTVPGFTTWNETVSPSATYTRFGANSSASDVVIWIVRGLVAVPATKLDAPGSGVGLGCGVGVGGGVGVGEEVAEGGGLGDGVGDGDGDGDGV